MSAWLEGIADSAQAQNDGLYRRAEELARAALAAQPAGAAGARGRLALGLALRGEGRSAEAAVFLAGAIPSVDAAVRLHLLAALAETLHRAGHPQRAAPLFSAIASESDEPLAEQARWQEASSLLDAGSPEPAAMAYQTLLEAHPDSAIAQLALGTAFRLMGDRDQALEQYRRVWLEHPGTPESENAEYELRRWGPAGVPAGWLGVEDRLARVEQLLLQTRARQALKALDQLEVDPAPAPLRSRSRLLRALALVQLSRFGEAELLARPLARTSSPEDRTAIEWILARAAAKQGRTDAAASHYRHLSTVANPRIPGFSPQQLHDLPENAAFLAAWLYYEAGRYLEAEKKLSQYIRARPGSRRTENAKWFRAWCLRRLGRRTEAVRAFASLENGPLREASLYWQARLASTPSRAEALYRAAFQSAAPWSWYGLLAGERLAAMRRPVPPPLPPPPARPLDEDPPVPSLVRAAALLGLGMRGEAFEELSWLARHPGAAAPHLAQLAEYAGDAEIPYRIARDFLLPTPRALRWSYPRPYPTLLFERCAGFNIDPWLLLAVMRRESHFRREIRSSAAAEGLLQLLPPTAERLATLLGIPLDLAHRLSEPETNVSFGSYYLGLLSARLRDPVMVLAAYNAGPVAATAWARKNARLALDEWVEAIPYRETRHYIRIVMSDLALYRRLNGLPAPLIVPGRRVAIPPPGVTF